MEINVEIPVLYKRIVKEFNGAKPKLNVLYTIEGKGVRIRSFLPVGNNYRDNLVAVNKRLSYVFSHHLVAFANDDFGNYFCFLFKEEQADKVVFWEHENSELHVISQNSSKSLFNEYF